MSGIPASERVVSVSDVGLLLRRGMTHREAAKELGCGAGTIGRRAKEWFATGCRLDVAIANERPARGDEVPFANRVARRLAAPIVSVVPPAPVPPRGEHERAIWAAQADAIARIAATVNADRYDPNSPDGGRRPITDRIEWEACKWVASRALASADATIVAQATIVSQGAWGDVMQGVQQGSEDEDARLDAIEAVQNQVVTARAKHIVNEPDDAA